MIYGGLSGFMGAALPHQELLSGGLGALPHEQLLSGRQSTIFQPSLGAYNPVSPMAALFGAFDPISPMSPVIHVDLDTMASQLGLLPKFVKDIGKGVAKGVKGAANAVADAGKAVGKGVVTGARAVGGAVADAASLAGKGLMAAGKFTVKIGGKIVDLALLPFNVLLEISMKIGDIICALPPQLVAQAATAAATASGAPAVPPQAAGAARDAFCSTLSALKQSGVKNVQDMAKLSKMVPVMMKIATEAPKIANAMQAQAANAGVTQQMQAAGASPAETAAAEQLTAVTEIDGLLTAAGNEMKNLQKNVGTAFSQGKRAASTLLKNPQVLKTATAMMQNMAAGAAAASAGQPPEVAAGAAPQQAVKADPNVARLQAEIRQFKILGRHDLVAKMTPRLNAAIQASLSAEGTMQGYMLGAVPSSNGRKWAYGMLLAGSLLAVGAGAFAVTRR